MGLQERLVADLKQAMRDKDILRRDVLRMVRSALQYAQIETQQPLTDEQVLAVIGKEVKKRHEAIEMFTKANRLELVAQEKAEMAILESYLPQQLSEQEIEAAVAAIVEEMGASGPKQFGPIMGRAMAQLRGQADGKLVNQVVKRLLGA